MEENNYYWIRLATGWCPAQRIKKYSWLHCKDKTDNQEVLEVGPIINMPKDKRRLPKLMLSMDEIGDIIKGIIILRSTRLYLHNYYTAKHANKLNRIGDRRAWELVLKTYHNLVEELKDDNRHFDYIVMELVDQSKWAERRRRDNDSNN